MGGDTEMLADELSQVGTARPRKFRSCCISAIVAGIVLSLSACQGGDKGSAPASPTSDASAAYKPVASIKELMDSTVDPSADGVWDAVGVVTTKAGVDKHQPRNDEEWHAVRRHAVTLIESMNLLLMPDRRAAPAGTRAGLGEQTPEQIDAMIKSNRPEFDQFAVAVRDSAEAALQAIDKKDPVALTRIGGELDDRCEGCHVTYWYPNSPRPKS